MNNSEYVLKTLKHIGLVTACIVDLINNNQNIRRYCRYKSKTPLAPIGIIGNKKIPQPNITTGLDEIVYDNSGEILYKPVLFDCMFDSEMQTELELGIYVYDYNSDFDKTFGKCMISVDIIVPYDFEKLQSKGDKRTIMLANEIVNTLCNKPITKENNIDWFNELGDVEFSIKKITNGRLSQKNNSIRRTLIFETMVNKRPVLK